MGIIEVVVALAIMLIGGLAMMTMVSSQQKQTQVIGNKLELLELEQSVVRLIADDNNCGCMFQGHSATVTGGQSEINFTEMKNGCQAGTNNNLIAVGRPLNTGSQLSIKSIKLINMMDIGSGNKSGDLEIAIDAGSGSFKPIIIAARSFAFDTSGAITHCLTSGIHASPITKCAVKQKIYIGFTAPFNGQKPDEDGCLALTAFRGPPGPAGDSYSPPASSGTSGSGTGTGSGSASSSGSPLGPSGTVNGGGSCIVYTSGLCAGGCGPGGTPGTPEYCPSTWQFTGAGQDGGCAAGYNQQHAGQVAAGTTGFICVVP